MLVFDCLYLSIDLFSRFNTSIWFLLQLLDHSSISSLVEEIIGAAALVSSESKMKLKIYFLKALNHLGILDDFSFGTLAVVGSAVAGMGTGLFGLLA